MHDERGLSGSVQVVLLLPLILGVFLLGLQWAMISWARTTAHAAAQDGARAAAALGATADQGREAALAAAANGSLLQSTASVIRGAREARASVTGEALAVVPGFPTKIQAVATAPVERL